MGAWIIVPILGALLAIASFRGIPSNFQDKGNQEVLSEQTQTVSPEPSATVSPTLEPSPSIAPSIEPTPIPTLIPSPSLTPKPIIATPKSTIIPTPTPKPSAAPKINEAPTNPEGATAICRDGTPSYSQSRQGTCSHHGGVAQWL